jgi:hypothetical protein
VKQINRKYFIFFVTTDSSDHVQMTANWGLEQDNSNSNSEKKNL